MQCRRKKDDHCITAAWRACTHTHRHSLPSHKKLMHQWENNPNCFSAIWSGCWLRPFPACLMERCETFVLWNCKPPDAKPSHFLSSWNKKRAVLKLIIERMRCRWGVCFPRGTQGKMLFRKALSEKQSLACCSGVIGWWCTAVLVANGCSVDKQCSKQSENASFSYFLPFHYIIHRFWPRRMR